MRYSIIRDGKVVNHIDANEEFIFNHFNDAVVYPEELPLGWSYDFHSNKVFTESKVKLDPDLVLPTEGYTNQAIRLITKRSFMNRFTQAERIAIRNSTDDIVVDIQEDLKSTDKVDLDLPALYSGLMYLVSVGIIDSNRVDEILVNGTIEERYV